MVVYSGGAIDTGFVQSYLEANGIKTYLKDVYMGTLQPWVVAPGGAGAIKVMVARSQFEAARRLVEAFMAEADEDLRPNFDG